MKPPLPLVTLLLCLAFPFKESGAAEQTGHLHGCIKGDLPPDLKVWAIPIATPTPKATRLTLTGSCFSADLPRTSYLVRAQADGWRGQGPVVFLSDDGQVDLKLLPANGSNPQLAEQLHQMAKVDQAARQNLDFNNQEALRAMEEVDKKNEAVLREILKTYGWPSAELVGIEGAHECWLLTQHAPYDLQKAYLPAMQEAAARGDLTASNVALTVDRVLVREEKKQLYGSQFKVKPSGELEPDPIEDPEHLDERRAQMGLGPFEEYRKQLAGKK